MERIARSLLALLPLLCVAGFAGAGSITIGSSKDNTLFEPSILGERSNGAGTAMFAGLTATSGLRRAVIAFDVVTALPRGAVVTSATMRLVVTRQVFLAPAADFAVHRLTADWGEAGSDAGDPGGQGAEPMPGDATWSHRFFDLEFWATAGGDFDAMPSDAINIGTLGAHSWGGAAMAADVQAWRDTPTTNFGWIVRGDEANGGLAREFATRESLTEESRPALEIEFTPPCAGDANRSGTVVFEDILVVLANFGANYGDGWGPGDADLNGVVNFNDVLAVLANFGAACPV